MVLISVLFLLLFPTVLMGYGFVFLKHRSSGGKRSMISCYLIGFFVLLALFTVASIACTIAGKAFHDLNTAFSIIYFCGLASFALTVMKEKSYLKIPPFINKSFLYLKKHWWIIIPIVIIVLQIVRSVAMTNSVYSDDKYYITRINDMISLDRILETDDRTGAILESARMSNPKFVLSSWLQFLAVLCAMTGIHPLILIKTIYPVFMISFHYMMIWKLTYYLSEDNKKRVLMLLFYTLLMEFGSISLRTDYSYYLFTWSWYGKTAYQFAVIPGVLLFFLQIQDYTTGWKEGLLLLIICLAGIGTSTTALMLLPVELGLLLFFECASKRTVREMWLAVPAFVPIGVCSLMYFVLF